LENSGLEITDANATRVGVVIGSGIGGFPLTERQRDVVRDRGPRKVSPFFIPGAIINMCSGLVSIRTGAKGPNMATCTACSTSAHAIGDALLYIRHGYADAIIAGGSEAVITPLALAGFSSMRALSTRNDEPERASRPWDKDRDGFVMGEGAGIVILEELEHAKRRGAPILAEVLGFGMTSDAYHISAPSEDGDGAKRVIRCALDDAGLNPEDVDYINAHGTSTPAGDVVETRALKGVFGDYAKKIMVSSTKSMTGHLLGASGGLEFGIIVLSLVNGIVPPTVNLDEPDAENDLDYVPHTARDAKINVALTNSFGFGGTNACLAIGRVK
ncbi:MAG: beta-ketoacyl-[acyl-carrier-protein] synthase II, partial [Candidatus Aminicenantes bacterium]